MPLEQDPIVIARRWLRFIKESRDAIASLGRQRSRLNVRIQAVSSECGCAMSDAIRTVAHEKLNEQIQRMQRAIQNIDFTERGTK